MIPAVRALMTLVKRIRVAFLIREKDSLSTEGRTRRRTNGKPSDTEMSKGFHTLFWLGYSLIWMMALLLVRRWLPFTVCTRTETL